MSNATFDKGTLGQLSHFSGSYGKGDIMACATFNEWDLMITAKNRQRGLSQYHI